MIPDRASLRSGLRSQRRAIPAPRRIAAADALANRLLSLAFAPESGYVAGYWAMDGEIALHSWQLRLPHAAIYCLPVLHHENRLRFAPWRPGDALVTNRFGIPEPHVAADSALSPEAMSMVVMPLVGFDGAGRRLGMGGGWYDRSFAFRNSSMPPPWLVGVGFDAQRVDTLASEAWDVMPDAICTETETLLARPHEDTPHE
ncbi:MAG: 5-formyltetrahydrofolate cyclo-ligase [Pseudoxanthomonas sp.]